MGNNKENRVDILALVQRSLAIDEQVRDYIYPKLYTLYNEKKLNKGHLPPHRQAKESVTIRDFSSNGEKISVHIDVWFGGDCYDDEHVTLTREEWDAIEDTIYSNEHSNTTVTEITRCQSGRDGECFHPSCPQHRDGEPDKTGRNCPLPHWSDTDDYEH